MAKRYACAMSVNDLNATYSAWSRTYDSTPNPLFPIEETAVHSLVKSIEFNSALDAGTGTGRHAIHLADRGKNVYAVDTNRDMLREAKRKAVKQRLAIKFLLNDIRYLSFKEGYFDLVVCALTLAHIESLDEPCHELLRVLRRGGSLIISDLHPFVQAEFGPGFETQVIEGEEKLYFPNHHGEVSEYTDAIQLGGGELISVFDVPLENKGEIFPGALVILAKKS